MHEDGEANENVMGFGQVIPLLFISLPVFTAIETLSGSSIPVEAHPLQKNGIAQRRIYLCYSPE
jgi:hypothetical protein